MSGSGHPPSNVRDPQPLDLDALFGDSTPEENRAWIEAYSAEAARLRAIGSHDDIVVEPNGDVIRVVDGRRVVIEFGPTPADAPMSWFDPHSLL